MPPLARKAFPRTRLPPALAGSTLHRKTQRISSGTFLGPSEETGLSSGSWSVCTASVGILLVSWPVSVLGCAPLPDWLFLTHGGILAPQDKGQDQGRFDEWLQLLSSLEADTTLSFISAHL